MRARQLLVQLGGDADGGWTSAQLAAAIERSVRAGQLPAGVDLPSERDLAVAIGRSRGTVARAYEQLRDEGLAHTRHGAGTTIGCCAGPWASSRGADLVSLEPLTAPEAPPERGHLTDLRSGRWAPHLQATDHRPDADRAVDPTVDRDAQRARLARHASRAGVQIAAEHLCSTAGRLRAVDVAVATLVQPGGSILVPERTHPRVLALLRVRGFHLIGLPIDRTGRPDVPAWLARIRARRAGAALLAASHAGPHGFVLAPHERHLLAEALADADVALAEDVTDADLWVEEPPPPPLASFGPGIEERTLLLGEVDPPGSVAWLHTPNAALAARMRTACRALDASPSSVVLATAARAALVDGGLAVRRRRHLAAHTAALIRLVTPAAPEVSLRAAAGGSTRWLAVGALPGSLVADALQERDVLVTPGAHWTVGGDSDPAAVTVSLTGSTGELVAGIRSLIEVVAELR